jgi:hypothetical protein
MRKVVVNEGLDKQCGDVVFAPSCERLLVIRQRSDQPVSRHVSSTNAVPALPLAIVEQRVGSRWKSHCWTKAPDQISRIRRRKEHTRVDVA